MRDGVVGCKPRNALKWWHVLKLRALKLEYSGRSSSIPWMLMLWLPVSPGQTPWYWLRKIDVWLPFWGQISSVYTISVTWNDREYTELYMFVETNSAQHMLFTWPPGSSRSPLAGYGPQDDMMRLTKLWWKWRQSTGEVFLQEMMKFFWIC